MVNPSSDLDSFEKLLVSKNSEPERDRKLYDLYKSAVAERDIMTERLSIYHVRNYFALELSDGSVWAHTASACFMSTEKLQSRGREVPTTGRGK